MHRRYAERQEQPAAGCGDILQKRRSIAEFEDYSMQNRTYRYFTGKPFTLSVTAELYNLGYSNLKLPEGAIHAGDPLVATITLTNTESRRR